MKQLIIENRLPVSIYVRVEMTPRIDAETDKKIVETVLHFEQPQCDKPELCIREVATMEQYTFDLPGDPLIEMNADDMVQYVNFGVSEDTEKILIQLIDFKPARN